MNREIPKFDIPIDFIIGKDISTQILKMYSNYPCHIKAGIMVLCMGGSVRSSINLNEYTIRQNDMVILSPGTFIQIHDIEGDLKLYYAVFSSSFVSSTNFFPLIISTPVIKLQDDIAESYSHFLSAISILNESAMTAAKHDISNMVLSVFLAYAGEHFRNNADITTDRSRENEIYRSFMHLLLENHTKEHKVAFYARAQGLTLQHFCNTIKRVSGKTALQAITAMVVINAKAQLRTTDTPVNKIAENLGFGNAAFFNKYFKKNVGLTPIEYRNSI